MRSGPLAGIVVALAVLLGARAAHAQRDVTEPVGVAAEPARKLERSFAQQIADRLTWLGGQMDSHLGALSMGRMDIRFDGRGRRAHIGLGKGDGGMLSMRIAGDVKFERGLARVATKLNFTVNGTQLQLQLPDVELVPRQWGGENYLEVRIPLLEGTFEPERWLGLK